MKRNILTVIGLLIAFALGLVYGERRMLKLSFSRIDKAYDLGFDACVEEVEGKVTRGQAF